LDPQTSRIPQRLSKAAFRYGDRGRMQDVGILTQLLYLKLAGVARGEWLSETKGA